MEPGFVQRMDGYCGAMPISCATHVITVSDRVASGERTDASGPLAVSILADAGYATTSSCVADGVASVRDALRAALEAGAQFIVTTGGTGVSPRDQTPEATAGVVERLLPGIPEMFRAEGMKKSPHAALTRGLVGVVGRALVVNLPGSPKAVSESLDVLLPLVPHILDQLDGGDH